MAEPKVVWGVWEHDWEEDFLYGLYLHLEDAVEHVRQAGRERLVIERLPILDGFPGLEGATARGWESTVEKGPTIPLSREPVRAAFMGSVGYP